MAKWRTLPGILDPIPIREFKGVNKLDPFSIGDEYATYVNNFTSAGYPALTVRQGFSNLGTSLGAGIVGLAAWKDAELHAIANGSWVKWTGSAWSTALLAGLSTTAQWSFCNFQGNLTGINLIGVNGAMSKKYDGTSVTDLTGIPAGCTYIDQHDNRLYAVNGNTVNFSGLRKAQDWTSTDPSTGAGSIVVETPDGKTITAIRSGPKTLIVFKDRYMFKLMGTTPLDYSLIPVTEKIGCVGNNAVLMFRGVLYFLGWDGIYSYTNGLPDKDFSLPVQYYVDNINVANAYKSCFGTDGKRLYMALPIGTATDPSHILEYDPSYGTWYVWQLGHYPRNFAYMNGNWYNGDSAGQVHQMNSGTTDAGTATPWEWQSKPFGENSLAQKKEWFDLWVVLTLPVGSTANIYLTTDPTDSATWTLVNTLTANAAIQSTRVIIPVNQIANANWGRIKISGTGPATVNEITRQERLLPYV